MAGIRVQVWLNPHFIVAPAEGRARRAASQLPHLNKDREVSFPWEKSRESFSLRGQCRATTPISRTSKSARETLSVRSVCGQHRYPSARKLL